MTTWQIVLLAVLVLLLVTAVAFVVWMRRAAMTPAEAGAELKALGIDLVRLPNRLRHLAADPRTPRRARWWLIGLAVYVASPIDPIPDFLPVIGQLDELIVVPLVLRRVRAMIPAEVWLEYFPPRAAARTPSETHVEASGRDERPRRGGEDAPSVWQRLRRRLGGA